MRILKQKIAKAVALKSIFNQPLSPTSTNPSTPEIEIASQSSPCMDLAKAPQKRNRVAGKNSTPGSLLATKNIAKNYGKAICTFATSHVAVYYLEEIVKKETAVTIPEFLDYVESTKNQIEGLHHFRSVLLVNESDDEKTTAFKNIFKFICEFFIKYFSVNWIFHSKIKHKEAHLKFRFRMLRRIQSPEQFTYLKDTKKSARKKSSL